MTVEEERVSETSTAAPYSDDSEKKTLKMLIPHSTSSSL
jgi:hypothetical protein